MPEMEDSPVVPGGVRQSVAGVAAAILAEAVSIVTDGTVTEPRPGQAALSADVFANMDSIGHLLGQAPTGSGKSLAYLSPAVALAVQLGERTIVSTESLTLQAQIIDKDGPTVAAAAETITGRRPTFAIHKGWSNFVCTMRTVRVAEIALEQLSPTSPGSLWRPAEYPETRRGLAMMRADLQRIAADPGHRLDALRIRVDHVDLPARPVVEVLDWALAASAGSTDYDDRTGDKDRCPVDIPEALWGLLSTSTGGCLGVDDCGFGEVCLPSRSRERAADADIIVTNHALLGIQAAKGVPVVLSSKRLGMFHHIVVDEAHALPDWVRNAGAGEVSSARVERLVRSMERAWDRRPSPDGLFSDGRSVAELVDQILGAAATELQQASREQRNKPRSDALIELDEETNPLLDIETALTRWLTRCSDGLNNLRAELTSISAPKDQVIAAWRATEAVDGLKADLKDACTPDVDVARWMEWDGTGDREHAVIKLSPVNVGGLLTGRVWSARLEADPSSNGRPIPARRPSTELASASAAANATLAPTSERDHDGYDPDDPATWGHEDFDPDDGSDQTTEDSPLYSLSVTTLSATIPRVFARDGGVRSEIRRYPSPFADAYARSLLYVPMVPAGSADFDALVDNRHSGPKAKFDTGRHAGWAMQRILELVEANGGSALVLSATSASGNRYAEALQRAAAGRWKVRSQWDPAPKSKTIAAWRSDTSSVLVGTKSLMTGVDAPGGTCSLVILDRVPRSRNNPVDEARTRSVAAAAEIDYWTATSSTYVSDAATLLEQAAGRLIRSTTDSGIVAVLDPRLHPKGPFSMAARDRKVYLDGLVAFTNRTSRWDNVVAFAHGHRESVDRAA